MGALNRFAKRIAVLFRRKRFNCELDEEMAYHRGQVEQDFRAGGMTAEAARHAAMRQFGNEARLKDQAQEMVGFRVETVLHDLRFALRQLRKNPGFAATAIAILALGMGVSVAIFSFVDAALLEPLPYADPNRLMSVDEASANRPRTNLSRYDYDDWKRLNKSLSSFDVYSGMGFLLKTKSGIEPVPAGRVSDGFFTTLGVRAMLGRVFGPGEDRPGGARLVMLSYGTWLKRFGGRRDVVGQSVSLSNLDYTIVGVLPREFAFAPRGNAEFWVPLLDRWGCEERRSCHNLFGIGRLRDGVTMQAAREEMRGIAARLEEQYPDSNKGQSASVQPLSEIIVGDVRPILLTLLAGAGLLLMIACVNLASLLLVRSESRKREIAVRGALGATPVRLVRQFVTEGLLLAAAGSAGGVVCASWFMTLLSRLVPKDMAQRLPFLGGVGMNAHTAAFAGAVALLAAAVLSITPVLRLSFLDIQGGLAEGGRSSAGRLWRRMGANLVMVELAVAMVLLVGAGLLGKSFYRLLHVEEGFDPSHLAIVWAIAPDNLYTSGSQRVGFLREVVQRISSLPGVQGVGITSDPPVQCNCDTDWIRIVGKPYHGEHNEVNERNVSAGYLPTLKARLVRGRLFNDDEDVNKPNIVVINEALARKYFPGEDPIGQKIADDDLTPKSMREVIGVVADLREGELDSEMWPSEYVPINQTAGPEYFAVVARTGQDEHSLLPTIVSMMHQIDPNVGTYGEITMMDEIGATQAALLHRFSTWLVGGFAVIALLLGVVGLYGVIAYSVGQRTWEIGVRMALGAPRSAVYRMILTEAGRLIAAGVAVGMAGAMMAATLMRKLLFGVQAWDGATLAAVAAVLVVAALLASYLPARRAASVNPTDALRAE